MRSCALAAAPGGCAHSQPRGWLFASPPFPTGILLVTMAIVDELGGLSGRSGRTWAALAASDDYFPFSFFLFACVHPSAPTHAAVHVHVHVSASVRALWPPLPCATAQCSDGPVGVVSRLRGALVCGGPGWPIVCADMTCRSRDRRSGLVFASFEYLSV